MQRRPQTIRLRPHREWCPVVRRWTPRYQEISLTLASGKGRPPAAAYQQPGSDGEIDQVPGEAVEEGSLVGPEQIEDRPGYPAAQRHAQERHHQHDAEPRATSDAGKYSRMMKA